MALLYYSNDEIIDIDRIIKLKQELHCNEKFIYKPIGIWFLTDLDRYDNIYDEEYYFLFDTLCSYLYEFELNDTTNILKISNIKELAGFTHEFSREFVTNKHEFHIDWKSVINKYDGMIISNFDEIKKEIMLMKNIYLVSALSWIFNLKCSCACIFKPGILVQKNKLMNL
jgi:hypothetical protein